MTPQKPALTVTEQQAVPHFTTLWLVRHAEVEERYQKVFGGRIDMALSAQGHKQATALADYLLGRKFDALYASPMKRVQQTLAPLLASGMPQPVIMTELREVDFGAWTGLGWDDVRSQFGVSAFEWLAQLDCDGITNAECGRVFRGRVEPALREILAKHSGEQVIVLCHGGVICMLLSILLDLPLPKLARFDIDYASITQVLWSPSRTKVRLLNYTPWRR